MSGRFKVVHIVNWYPNKWNSQEALWTKRHIQGLNELCQNEVYHVEVRNGKPGIHFYKISEYEHAFIVTTNLKVWILREVLTTLLLTYVLLFKVDRRDAKIFNFQISYPLLTYTRWIQYLVKKKIVVTEHWSAYHLNFGVTKDLPRIQQIFKNKDLRFICVSDALRNDIDNFAKTKIRYKIVHNVIPTEIFSFRNQERLSRSFFMLSYWKYPKDPILLFGVFKKLKEENLDFKLTVGGFGPLLEEMQEYIRVNDLTDNINLVGELSPREVSMNLNKHQFFLHASEYEVASVVCMEAICCGTPTIASSVGGIVEYINEKNGILVDASEKPESQWYSTLKPLLSKEYDYDNESIAREGVELFGMKSVSIKYYQALKDFYNET